MYCMGVKRMASRQTVFTKSNTFDSLSIPFTFSNYNKIYSTYLNYLLNWQPVGQEAPTLTIVQLSKSSAWNQI